MDARTVRFALLLSALCSMGANYRTPNFLVTARSPQFAKQVGDYAEQFRRDLAMEWLGQELPRWHEPCPVTVDAAPQLGAGGATSFMFDQGRPFGWTMSVQGSEQRILDSVLPHEVTHTIFATHFGGPLPRWADEGACTTVEHPSERAKQQKFLIEFLSTSRGIPFNRMFAMTEYPHDILPLYSQGHSVAQYLIHQGGKRKFIDFVGRGMQVRDWDAAVMEFYGFRDLSDLQLTWVDWVRAGSPGDVSTRPQLASREAPPASQRNTPRTLMAVPRPSGGTATRASVGRPTQLASRTSSTSSGSWYARQRDRGSVETPRQPQSAKSPQNVPGQMDAATQRARQWNSRARIPVEDRLQGAPDRSPVYYDAPPQGAPTYWR